MAPIAAASIPSPIENETAAAAISNATSGSANWRSAIARYAGLYSRSSRLGPKRTRRSLASSSLRPRSESLDSCRVTSSHAAAWAAFTESLRMSVDLALAGEVQDLNQLVGAARGVIGCHYRCGVRGQEAD